MVYLSLVTAAVSVEEKEENETEIVHCVCLEQFLRAHHCAISRQSEREREREW